MKSSLLEFEEKFEENHTYSQKKLAFNMKIAV